MGNNSFTVDACLQVKFVGFISLAPLVRIWYSSDIFVDWRYPVLKYTGIKTVLLGLFCAVHCGCLLNHSNHVVLRQNEPLNSLTFQSDHARNVFESRVEQSLEDDSRKSSASFGVPFLVGLERSTTIAENAIRNDLAALFDINGDQHISDYEASLRINR